MSRLIISKITSPAQICSPELQTHIQLPAWNFHLDVSQPSHIGRVQCWLLIWPPRPVLLTTLPVSVNDNSVFPVIQAKNLDSSLTLCFSSHQYIINYQEILLFLPSNLYRIWPLSTNASGTIWSESTTTSCLDYSSDLLCQFRLRSRYSGTICARDLLSEMPVKNKGEGVELAERASDRDTGLTPGKAEQEGNRIGQEEPQTGVLLGQSQLGCWGAAESMSPNRGVP